MTDREALLRTLPGLTKFYGLTPADVEHMTRREIDEYVRQMVQEINRNGT